MMRHTRALATAAAVIAMFGVSAASAGSDPDNDHDQALELYEHGEINSLADVIRALHQKVGGQVVDVNLDHKGDHWTYVLTVITDSGKRVRVSVDANSLAITEGGGD